MLYNNRLQIVCCCHNRINSIAHLKKKTSIENRKKKFPEISKEFSLKAHHQSTCIHVIIWGASNVELLIFPSTFFSHQQFYKLDFDRFIHHRRASVV